MPANIELDYRLTSKINCISGAIISQQTYMVLNTEKMKEIENVKINENNNFGLNLRQQSYIDIKECEK